MITVALTHSDLEYAAQIGARRRIASRYGAKPFDQAGVQDSWDMDIEGAAAELAYAKHRNEFWSASVGNYDGPDHGRNTQIRHTKLETGCLILRPADDAKYHYVLVVGVAPVYRIAGWIRGVGAKRERFLKAPAGRPPAWFVPQKDLQQFGGKS